MNQGWQIRRVWTERSKYTELVPLYHKQFLVYCYTADSPVHFFRINNWKKWKLISIGFINALMHCEQKSNIICQRFKMMKRCEIQQFVSKSNLINKKMQFSGYYSDTFYWILIIESKMQTKRQAHHFHLLKLILPWASYAYHQVAVLQTADQWASRRSVMSSVIGYNFVWISQLICNKLVGGTLNDV
jgi:hypothetical protein